MENKNNNNNINSNHSINSIDGASTPPLNKRYDDIPSNPLHQSSASQQPQPQQQGIFIQHPSQPVQQPSSFTLDNNFLYQQFKLLEANKIAKTEQKMRKDKKNAILMFCFGWIFFPLWVGGFAFLRSPSKVARDLGISALVFFSLVSTVVIVASFLYFDFNVHNRTYNNYYNNDYNNNGYNYYSTSGNMNSFTNDFNNRRNNDFGFGDDDF
ncbi:hypothetical protein DFA_02357 [Cavenderia fasciculata]|uniref:Transmembrane protein n=1 Tax=Cavenderia fasciculata TaxID=261658 RepID=F4PZ82_CACFS|nr:uncharacterized protein DFA_02357 [Cavenderia fasciculata]EGG19111.1 hypothetical protein DFA_02357 [Cavenderia fasciculata]|eukprot:XP_004366744.1 hypothetical protein DFA_02357 [Cavenderia fasciculata]